MYSKKSLYYVVFETKNNKIICRNIIVNKPTQGGNLKSVINNSFNNVKEIKAIEYINTVFVVN